MKPIELFQKALDKEKIEVRFDLKAGEETLPAKITALDIREIAKLQEIEYEIKRAELESTRGIGGMLINERKWKIDIQSQLDNMKMGEKESKEDFKKRVDGRRIELEKEKPSTLAEQLATRFSRFDLLPVMLPRFLKNPDGRLIFETVEDQQQFEKILKANMELLTFITEKYLEVIDKMNKAREAAKNS